LATNISLKLPEPDYDISSKPIGLYYPYFQCGFIARHVARKMTNSSATKDGFPFASAVGYPP